MSSLKGKGDVPEGEDDASLSCEDAAAGLDVSVTLSADMMGIPSTSPSQPSVPLLSLRGTAEVAPQPDCTARDDALAAILSSRSRSRSFEAYLRGAYCAENLLFWQAVEAFKAMPKAQHEEEALKLWTTYLVMHSEVMWGSRSSEASVSVVNISSAVYDTLKARMEAKDYSRDMFDDAQGEAYVMMKENNLAGFLAIEVEDPNADKPTPNLVVSPRVNRMLKTGEMPASRVHVSGSHFVNDFPNMKLPSQRVRGSSALSVDLSGPTTADREELVLPPHKYVVACAQSVSTYPKISSEVRLGDPIADAYYVHIKPGLSVMAVADGCRWGPKAQQAATRAALSFVEYFKTRPHSPRDLNEASVRLRKAMEYAHEAIIASKPTLWELGTTSLAGGLVFPIEEKASQDLGALFISVGNIKIFRWCARQAVMNEVTAGSTMDVKDDNDPGGRLGPYSESDKPDLRNLTSYFVQCEDGDILLFLTQGVYENFSPIAMGVSPAMCGFEGDKWDDLDADRTSVRQVLEKRRLGMLQELVASLQPEVSVSRITEAVIQHCSDITKATRDFCEANPSKQVPKDPSKYPGCMEHTTCLAFQVGKPLSAKGWEWTAFLPASAMESGQGGDVDAVPFDVWSEMEPFFPGLSKLAADKEAIVSKELWINLFDERCIGRLHEGSLLELRLLKGIRSHACLWQTAPMIQLHDAMKKGKLLKRLKRDLGQFTDTLSSDYLKQLMGKISGIVPQRDVLEIVTTSKSFSYEDLVSIASSSVHSTLNRRRRAVISGSQSDLRIEQTDMQIFGRSNALLGTYRIVSVRARDHMSVIEFVNRDLLTSCNISMKRHCARIMTLNDLLILLNPM